jgi:hypothetical protein
MEEEIKRITFSALKREIIDLTAMLGAIPDWVGPGAVDVVTSQLAEKRARLGELTLDRLADV